MTPNLIVTAAMTEAERSDHRMSSAVVWTVYTTWRAYGVVPSTETAETHPNWTTARRRALHLACCRGARYITVCGPDHVVVGGWDAYTNRWREYPRTFTEVTA